MSTRNYNIIDAYDELRRIGPMYTDAAQEMARLLRRLPADLVERIAEILTAPNLDIDEIGPKLTALADTMAAEVDALPECRQDALCEQIEERRRAQATRPVLIFGNPPGTRAEDVLPDDGPGEAA